MPQLSPVATSQLTCNLKAIINGVKSRALRRTQPHWRVSTVLLAFCWILSGLCASTICLAQQNMQHTQNNRDLGMRADARIDPSTLGMSLVIPLANYPGRAGNSYPVALYYNSKIWRLNYDAYVNGNQENCVNKPIIEAGTECYTTTIPIYAEHSVSGWTFGGFPRIENSGERYNVNGSACCEGDPNQGYYIGRLTVRFPNGATHELRRSDTVQSGADSFVGTYYAVDSSRLKYVSTSAGTGKLYLPDGSFYEVQNWASTKLVDRNGNFTLVSTDTLGRQIITPGFHNAFAHSSTHSIPGVNGTSLSYTFEMELLQDVLEPDLITGVVPALHRLGDMDKFGNSVYAPSLFASEWGSRVIGGSSTFNPVVLRRIILPNGKSYTFGYNQYGEITRVDHPTAGYERFSYGSIVPLAVISSPYSQANRGVLQRRISATGLATDEVTWTYSSTGTEVTTIAPDGTRTVRNLLPSATPSGVVFGLEDPRGGMVYEERVYKAASQGGAMMRRSLTSWIVSGPLSGGHASAKRNPRVDRQVDIILDTGGNALASATVMTYDADLNVTSNKRYDFVSLSPTTAQTAAIGTIANGTLLRRQETDYLTGDSAYRDRNLLTLPVETRLRNGVGTLIARSSITYDEYDQEDYPLLTYASVTGWQDPGTNARGNATTVSTWLNTTNSFLSAHTQYDQCGNMRNVWNARDTNQTNPSSIEYSATYHRAYPTSSTSADPDGAEPFQGLTSSTEYEFSTGLVIAQVDENGQRTTFSYNDPLNRLKQVIRAEAVTQVKTQTSYSYDDTARTITATSDLSTFNDNALKTMTLFDGLGRAIEARSYEGGTNYIASQTQYDALGRAFKTSNPFRPWLSETAVWTTQAFDALGRVISVTTPDNAAVTTSYSGTSITVSDQAGKQRKSVTDALGRLVQVYEAPNDASFNYLTQYTYDTLDNLTTVTQGSQTRTFVYDSLKRLTSATNPESGTTSYLYDNNGNLLVKTDARNVSAHYEYDRLNRPTRRWYNGSNSVSKTTQNDPALPSAVGTSNETKFFYDAQTLPLGAPSYTRGSSTGRLVAQTYGTGTNGDYFAYDALGRTTLKIQQTGSVNYQTSAVYNRASAITSMTYPSGRTVAHTFDAAGRLTTFSGTLGDGVNRTYANEMIYSSFGALAKEKFGTTTPIYNKLFYNVRGQLAEIRASTSYTGPTDYDANRGAIVNNYSNQCTGICSGVNMPDNNGNLLKQEIHIPNQTMRWQQYEYDSLNRLKSAREVLNAGAEQWKQQFTYDRWGNRTIDTVVTYGIGINNKAFTVNTGNNRLDVPTGQPGVMSYDNAGNLTNDTYTGAGNRTYDAENKITSAKGNNNQDQFYAYDGGGQRIKRTVNGVETWQVYGLGGELLAEYAANGPVASPQKEYGYRNGQLLVTATPADNQSLSLNGTSAYAQASSSSSLNIAGAITVEAWVKINAIGAYRAIVSREAFQQSGTGGGYRLAITDTGKVRLDLFQTHNTYVNLSGTTTITAGVWHHVAGVFNGTQMRVYLNGVLDGSLSTPSGPTSGTGSLHIGRFSYSLNPYYFNGLIDEARVSNAALYSSNFTPQQHLTSSSSTKGLWNFDGQTTADSSSNNNTVTLQGGATYSSEVPGGGGGSGATQIQWLVSDHLGTPRMIMDQTGTLANMKRHDYLPFGEELFAPAGGRTTAMGYGSGDGIRQQFTGKERDIETGLDYSINRYYGNQQGRFTSPDPTLLSLRASNPQTLNRYSYVLNNPLLFIDPLGLWELEYDPVYENGRTDRVRTIKVFFHKSKDGDNAETLLEQLGFDPKDKGYDAMKSQIEGAMKNMTALGIDASTLKGSVAGIDIGSTFRTIGDLLGTQANYDVQQHGRSPRTSGPTNLSFRDCTMTTARISFAEPLVNLGSIGTQDGETGMDERFLSGARPVQSGDLRLLDAVRYDGNGNSVNRHYMTVVFTGDDGQSQAFSRSGVSGRFQIVPVDAFVKPGSIYGNISGFGNNHTGFYRP